MSCHDKRTSALDQAVDIPLIGIILGTVRYFTMAGKLAILEVLYCNIWSLPPFDRIILELIDENFI